MNRPPGPGRGKSAITPQEPLKRGHRFEVTVEYDGVPHEFVIVFPDGFELRTGFMATPDGATVAGEPEVAAGWFPVNDHPLDKAAYSFDVTVPRGYEVVANGFLTQVSTRGGWTTYEWDASEPMASYLEPSTSAAGTSTNGRRIAAYPSMTRSTRRLPVGFARQSIPLWRARVRSSTSSRRHRRYPFSTVGGIVDNEGRPVLRPRKPNPARVLQILLARLRGTPDPVAGDLVVVHELAHQWFGDDVAVEHRQHIWLNEGFATYAEWIWSEHEGFATAQESFEDAYNSIPADDPFWDLVIGDPGVPALFDFPVYLRARYPPGVAQ